MDLSIIIISYNTRDILKTCLANLLTVQKHLKTNHREIEIIVVDNASSDGSGELVKNDFPTVKLIENSENLGISKSGNSAAKLAMGTYLLYLGSDAFPGTLTLLNMLEYFDDNPKVGIATCRLFTRDGSLDMDAHRGFPTPWAAITHFTKLNVLFPKSKLFNQYFLGYKDLNTPHEIDMCISHFMLIRKRVFEQIGGWDEDFFVFGEDVDICYRTKQAGWKIMYLPQWMSLHYKGAGVGRKETNDIKTVSNQDPEVKKRMKNERVRAMQLFYKKHYSKKYPRIVTSFVLFAVTLMKWVRR